MDPLGFDGAWLFSPRIHTDRRGAFLEWFRNDDLDRPLELAQANCSVSTRGVLRGVHYADVPPGQAKYVTCVSGSVLDVAVDLRRSSPSFGRHVAVELSAANWRQLLVPEGFAHGFCTLEPNTEVLYKVSAPYSPAHDLGLAWDDPFLGIAWPVLPGEAVLSDKDARHPRLPDLPHLFD